MRSTRRHHRAGRGARRGHHFHQHGRARHGYRLGEGVAELGGLYVIGTNKHESRRIDNQLRGRAGRQGDPGLSRFFISLEDDLHGAVRGSGSALPRRSRDHPAAGGRPAPGHAHVSARIRECRSKASGTRFTRSGKPFWRATCPNGNGDHPAHDRRPLGGPSGAGCGLALGRAVGFVERPRSASRVLVKVHQWFGELEAVLPEEIARRIEIHGDDFRSRRRCGRISPPTGRSRHGNITWRGRRHSGSQRFGGWARDQARASAPAAGNSTRWYTSASASRQPIDSSSIVSAAPIAFARSHRPSG